MDSIRQDSPNRGSSFFRLLLTLVAAIALVGQSAFIQPARAVQDQTEQPKSFWQAYMDGWQQLRNDQPDSAFTNFERALELKPNHTLTMVQLTRLLLKLERFDEAESMSQMALASDSASAPAHFVRGRVLQSTDRNEKAVEAYRKSIELRENNPYAYNNLGLIQIGEWQYEDAVSLLETAVEQKDDVVYFYNNLGIAYEGTHRFEKSRQAFEAAIELDPDYSKAITSLIRVKGLIGEAAIVESDTERPVTEPGQSTDETVKPGKPVDVVESSTKEEKITPGFKGSSSEKRDQTFVALRRRSNNDNDRDGTGAAVKFAGVLVLTIILAIAFFVRNNRRSELI